MLPALLNRVFAGKSEPERTGAELLAISVLDEQLRTNRGPSRTRSVVRCSARRALFVCRLRPATIRRIWVIGLIVATP